MEEGRSNEEALPLEVWLYIFSFLSVPETLRASIVNKRWHEMCNVDYLWKSHYHQRWPARDCSTSGLSQTQSKEVETINFLDALKTKGSDAGNQEYREEFKRRDSFERQGWFAGNYSMVAFQAHPVGESINKLKFISASSRTTEPVLITCSDDKTVKIWRAAEQPSIIGDEKREDSSDSGGKKRKKSKLTKKKKNKKEEKGDQQAQQLSEHELPLKCEHVLNGHAGYVFCLDTDGQRIVSGDFNRCVKVWNMNGRELRTLPDVQEGGVANIQLHENLILTCGGKDPTVNLTDIEAGKCIHQFRDEKAARIFALSASFNNDIFVCAGTGRKFFCWDLRSKSLLAVVAAIPEHEKTNMNEILRLNDNHQVVVGESEGVVKVWDLRRVREEGSESKVAEVEKYEHGIQEIRDVWYDRGRLVSAGKEGIIKVWNRATQAEVASLPFPSPWTLQADERVLVAGNRTGELRIYDFGGRRKGRQQKGCCIQ